MSAAVFRICLDEDVDVLLGRLLTARGFDCLSASELKHLAWTDERHLEWAAAEERILITHNRVDFEKLAVRWYRESKDHAGIVLAVRRSSTHELLRRILPVLLTYEQHDWRNVVMYA